jgi:hypothetical protein
MKEEYIHRAMGEFMEYAVEMASGAMINKDS